MLRQLLFSVTKKDLKIEYFKSGKSGGQRRDKVSTAVRITHPASGAVGQSQDQRSREQNRKIAFRRMVENPKFKAWHRIKTAEMTGIFEAVEEKVTEEMKPENLKVEIKERGKWVEYISSQD